MSAIFLSHSSHDNEQAAKVKAWLAGRGHRSVFLDFDPERGIPAGRSWEKELYQRLRTCRAVIVLCSEHSMRSRWCFAEIAHARSLGKHIFPVKIAATEIDSLLTDLQVVDLTANVEAGLSRLGRGLEAAGVDATDPFDWDGARPPYPGLLSFGEEDAAIFHGRDPEIGQGLDLINQMHRYGGASLLLVLGASGSGKSSLMRAGLLPRLRRAGRRWLIVDPFRPADDPERNLAAVLARAFRDTERPSTWQQIHGQLRAGGDRSSTALTTTLRELRLGAEHPDAAVVLLIDQFEELLGRGRQHVAHRFLDQLRAAMQSEATSLLVIATLRSDFLGTLQKHPALSDVPFREFSLPPMPHRRLREIVEKPAALAGIDLDPSLVQALVDDTAAEDALPLLAFTLRELWELWQQDGVRLGERHDYDRLGGLQGAVGRAANNVLASGQLTSAEEDRLRGAFLGMVRVDRDGQYARHVARWSSLSVQAHAWLERFVQARLLVSGGDATQPTLEVAHEALFVAWDRLARWLDENREALLVRRELVEASRLWDDAGRKTEDLWRGGRLARALELRNSTFEDRPSEPGEPGEPGRLALSAIEAAFLDAGEEAVARVHRLRKARRCAVTIGSLAFSFVCLCLFAWASWQHRLTEMQAARVLALQGYSFNEGLSLGLLLGIEALDTADGYEARSTLASLLGQAPRLVTVLDRQQAKIHALEINADRTRIAVGGDEGILRVVELRTGEVRTLTQDRRVRALAFAPGSDHLISSGSAVGDIQLWEVGRGTLARTFETAGCPDRGDRVPASINAVAFHPTRRRVAGADATGRIQLWDESTGRCLADVLGHGDDDNMQSVSALTFAPTGDLLASGGHDGRIQLWRTGDGMANAGRIPGFEGARIESLAFDPDGTLLASADVSGVVRLWSVGSTPITETNVFPIDQDAATALAFSPDGKTLAAAGSAGVIHLLDLERGTRRLRITAHSGTISALGFIDSSMLASAGTDQKLRLWRVDGGAMRVDTRGHEKEIDAIAFSSGGRFAATGSGDQTVRLWDLAAGQSHLQSVLPHTSDVAALAFAPDAEIDVRSDGDPVATWLAIGGRDGAVALWDLAIVPAQSITMQQVPREHRQFVWDIAFAPDGRRVAAATSGARIQLWNGLDAAPVALPVPESVAGPARRAPSVVFDAAGRWLAASSGPTVMLWDLSGCGVGQDVADCVGAPVTAVSANAGSELVSLAFSPDGQHLYAGDVVGGTDGGIHRWNLSNPTAPMPLPSLPGHESQTRALLVDPERGYLFSAGGDATVRIWNLASGDAWLELKGHEAMIHALHTHDGHLLSASADQTIRHWRIDQLFDVTSLRRHACAVANRDLTASERRQFFGGRGRDRATCDTKWPGLGELGLE